MRRRRLAERPEGRPRPQSSTDRTAQHIRRERCRGKGLPPALAVPDQKSLGCRGCGVGLLSDRANEFLRASHPQGGKCSLWQVEKNTLRWTVGYGVKACYTFALRSVKDVRHRGRIKALPSACRLREPGELARPGSDRAPRISIVYPCARNKPLLPGLLLPAILCPLIGRQGGRRPLSLLDLRGWLCDSSRRRQATGTSQAAAIGPP